MKKRQDHRKHNLHNKRTFFLILLVLAVFLASWFLLPKKTLEVHVHDKTVPLPANYREHKEFLYILKHERYENKEGRFLDPEKDYSGYHPEAEGGPRQERLKAAMLEDTDLLYLADTYGIYDYEDGLIDYEEKLPDQLIDIDLIFGGIDREEYQVIEDFAKNPAATLVGEHNVFGYPTYLYEDASVRLQELFGVSYSGWLIHYYEELDQVAYWVKLLYEKVYGKVMDVSGPGIVVVREDASRAGWYGDLIVFTEDELTDTYPLLIHQDKDHPLLKKVEDQIPYLYWLEVVDISQDQAQVLSYLELPIQESALNKLEERGLPSRFPAIILKEEKDQADTLYFTGDFADQMPALLPAWLTMSVKIQSLFTQVLGMPPQYDFYFRTYAPLMKNVLAQAKEKAELD